MKKYLLLLFFIIVLASSTYATGTCTLDKYSYHPGETGTFTCSCTTAQEENKAGNIIWRNSTGGVLQNTLLVSSGSCRTSFFGDSFTFSTSLVNYTGNVTFNTTSVVWADLDDIVTDTFNITGASVLDCEITNFSQQPYIKLGELNAVNLEIRNAADMNELIHASCLLDIADVSNIPFEFEPYGIGDTHRVSQSDGEVAFQFLANNDYWKTNTTYRYEFHCHCLPGDNDTVCYDETTGNTVGFKSCSATFLTSTGAEDKRFIDTPGSTGSVIAISLFILLITALVFFFPFLMDYFKKNMSESEYLNLIYRRLCYILATYLMIWNITLMAGMAVATRLNVVVGDLWIYLRLFGIVAYILIFYLLFKTVVDLMRIWSDSQNEKGGFR